MAWSPPVVWLSLLILFSPFYFVCWARPTSSYQPSLHLDGKDPHSHCGSHHTYGLCAPQCSTVPSILFYSYTYLAQVLCDMPYRHYHIFISRQPSRMEVITIPICRWENWNFKRFKKISKVTSHKWWTQDLKSHGLILIPNSSSCVILSSLSLSSSQDTL